MLGGNRRDGTSGDNRTARRLVRLVVRRLGLFDARGEVNRAFMDLTSYTKDELLGQSYHLLLSPEYRGRHAEMVEQIVKTGQARHIRKGVCPKRWNAGGGERDPLPRARAGGKADRAGQYCQTERVREQPWRTIQRPC